MSCKNCGSERLAHISGKTADCFNISLGSDSENGYVPHDAGIGAGDYVSFEYCLGCGQIQDEFPKYPMIFQKDDEDIDAAFKEVEWWEND